MLQVYENIYQPTQSPVLGSFFNVLDSSHLNDPKYYELSAFNYFCEKELWKSAALTGLFSPSFFNKMNIDQVQFIAFMMENPGFDVYLFHPFPLELSLQYDFLELAELEHPRITEAISFVWQKLFGRDLPQLFLPAHKKFCCHCNYFVGSQFFWSKYSIFVKKFFQLLHSPDGVFLRELTLYNLSRQGVSQVPIGVFVFERALSHFIYDFFSENRVINFTFFKKDFEPKQLFKGERVLIKSLNCIYGSDLLRFLCFDFRSKTFIYYQFRKLMMRLN